MSVQSKALHQARTLALLAASPRGMPEGDAPGPWHYDRGHGRTGPSRIRDRARRAREAGDRVIEVAHLRITLAGHEALTQKEFRAIAAVTR